MFASPALAVVVRGPVENWRIVPGGIANAVGASVHCGAFRLGEGDW